MGVGVVLVVVGKHEREKRKQKVDIIICSSVNVDGTDSPFWFIPVPASTGNCAIYQILVTCGDVHGCLKNN